MHIKMCVYTHIATHADSKYTCCVPSKGGRALVGLKKVYDEFLELYILEDYLSLFTLLSITASCMDNSGVGRGHLDQVTETPVGITITATYSCK